MKYSFGFLVALVCVTLGAPAVARVATTAGNNLTAFQGTGATNNNQWNNLTNARTQVASNNKAEANWDNCGAVILRCASPKCANGGCDNLDVARPIVVGCVKSNKTCEKYGDDFINTIAAQVAAQSVAKVREQQNAVETAKANAVAVAAQNDRTAEELRQQMAQMQSQMQETLDGMKNQPAPTPTVSSEPTSSTSATPANNPVITGTGPIATAQQIAYANGIDDTNILVREQVAGEIETQIENASNQLKELKKTLDGIIAYAGCDANGMNCTGPKRVTKFKEMANNFFDPYENVAESLYQSLLTAMGAGIDVKDVILLLTGGCNMWGKYLCSACRTDEREDGGEEGCRCALPDDNKVFNKNCFYDPNTDAGLKHCQFLTYLTDEVQVRYEWMDSSFGLNGAERLKCASDLALDNTLFAGVKKKKKATMDIDTLRNLINQDSRKTCSSKPGNENKYEEDDCGIEFCVVNKTYNYEDRYTNLQQYSSMPGNKFPSNICYDDKDDLEWADGNGKDEKNHKCEGDNIYFDPTYALCSVHSHNIGHIDEIDKPYSDPKAKVTQPVNPTKTEDINLMNEVIGMKTTVLVKQLKAQYDYLAATVKQLQNQLHKAVLTSQMEMMTGNIVSTAGSSYSGSNNMLAGATDCNSKSGVEVWECFSKNLSLVAQSLNSDRVAARKQLAKDYKAIDMRAGLDKDNIYCKKKTDGELDTSDNKIADCVQYLQAQVSKQIETERRAERQSYYRPY